MEQPYEQYLLELKKTIEEALTVTNQQIIDYLPTSNDEGVCVPCKKGYKLQRYLK